MSKRRLFFALWPDEATRQRLQLLSAALPEGCGRRVRRENLHLTLAFLGYVDEQRVPLLRGKAAEVRLPRFRLTLTQLGWFRRAQVIWVAPAAIPEALLQLVGRINGFVRDCGLSPEARPYQAHLTLARKARRAANGTSFEPISWEVKEFVLVESLTLPSGAEYQVVESWPLS